MGSCAADPCPVTLRLDTVTGPSLISVSFSTLLHPSLLLFPEEHPLRKAHVSNSAFRESESEGCSAMSHSLRPHGLYSPWNSPGQNTGVG